MDLPTRADLWRVAQDEALRLNPALSLAEINREGSDLNIAVAAGVAIGEQLVAQLARAIAGQNYGTARSQQLRRLVADRTGGEVVAKAAAPALGSVDFSSALGASGNFLIPQGTQLQTPGGLVFVTTAPATYPAGGHGPVSVPVRSVQAGASQQTPHDQIRSVLTALPGAPTDLAVTNPLATFGADDAEQDPQLVARARQFFPNARRGVLGALVNGALAVPGVRTAAAFEYVDPSGQPARAVELVVADAYTDALASLTAPPAGYAAQAATVASQIALSLDEYRAAGIPVLVRVAQVQLLQVNLALVVQSGADLLAVPARAQAAVVAVINALPPGATLTIDALVTALKAVAGLVRVSPTSITSPVTDVAALPLQVLRTTPALVKVT